MTEQQLTQTFEEFAKVIISLQNEYEEALKKYPPSAPFMIKKKDVVDSLANVYDRGKKGFQYYIKALHLMSINYQAMQLMTYKSEMGLNYEELSRLLGPELKEWQKLKVIDDRIKEIVDGIR